MTEIHDTSEIVKIARCVLSERQFKLWHMKWHEGKKPSERAAALGICTSLERAERVEAERKMDEACQNIQFGRVREGVTVERSHEAAWKPDLTAQGKDPTKRSNYPVHRINEDWWKG